MGCRASIRDDSSRADVLQLCHDEVPTLLFEIAPQDEPDPELSLEDVMPAIPDRNLTRRPATARPAADSNSHKASRIRRPSTAVVHAGPGNLRGARLRPTTAGGLGLYSNRKKYEAHFGHL